jgi:hypothetical protein
MKDRVLKPFGFEVRHGKPRLAGLLPPFEKFPLPLEIGFDGGEEEALAETPGPAKEIGVALLGQPVYVGAFIHIDIAAGSELLKVLNPDG